MIGTSGDADPLDSRRRWLVAIGGWGFVACAAVALGYSLWALFGSGESIGTFDLLAETRPAGAAAALHATDADCPSFGPLALDPGLGPFRAVLHAAYAPMGSTRLRYEIAMMDEAGRTLWDQRGALGSETDEAAFVRTVFSLIEFELERPGAYTFQVRFPEGDMDDLREATLELRGGIVRVDARIPWGFGLAALACLILGMAASRRLPFADRAGEEEFREAA